MNLNLDCKGRWTSYHLNLEYNNEMRGLEHEASNKGNTSEIKGNTSSTEIESAIENKGNTFDTNKGNTSDSKGNTSNVDKGNTKQRLSRDELQNNILKFCELEFYSVAEISQHVGKDVSYLKKTVIPEMIEKNLLARLFPSTINHPQQKYKKHE